MDHHPGRLVDDGKVRILKNDVERNVLRSGFERSGVRLTSDDNLLSTAELERGLGLQSVYEHVALIEKQSHAGAAHSIELRCNEVIEALTCCFGRNSDGSRLSHAVSPLARSARVEERGKGTGEHVATCAQRATMRP